MNIVSPSMRGPFTVRVAVVASRVMTNLLLIVALISLVLVESAS